MRRVESSHKSFLQQAEGDDDCRVEVVILKQLARFQISRPSERSRARIALTSGSGSAMVCSSRVSISTVLSVSGGRTSGDNGRVESMTTMMRSRGSAVSANCNSILVEKELPSMSAS